MKRFFCPTLYPLALTLTYETPKMLNPVSLPLPSTRTKSNTVVYQAFDTTAVRTTGQAKSPAGLFGVTVEALSGTFLKTHVVTVWPRFLVRNNLKRKVGIVPTLEIPRKDQHDWQQLGTRPTDVSVSGSWRF